MEQRKPGMDNSQIEGMQILKKKNTWEKFPRFHKKKYSSLAVYLVFNMNFEIYREKSPIFKLDKCTYICKMIYRVVYIYMLKYFMLRVL